MLSSGLAYAASDSDGDGVADDSDNCPTVANSGDSFTSKSIAAPRTNYGSNLAISDDGNYVVFNSTASDVVPNDTNAKQDVFLINLKSNSASRLSVNSSSAQGNEYSGGAAISADGSYVAFYSDATNLVSGDTNGTSDIFVKNTRSGAIARVNTSSSGAQGNKGSYDPAISGDGNMVVFESYDTNLTTGSDTNGVSDVYAKIISDGAIAKISVGPHGLQANGESYGAAVSKDGKFAAYNSTATNLVTADTNAVSDIFVRDLFGYKTTRVSTTSSGAQANGASFEASLSADGRYVAFKSAATNLVSGDSNGVADIFRKDTKTGTILRVSTTASGAQANGVSFGAQISADGRYVAFNSKATNLVTGDSNRTTDTFIKDLTSGKIVRVSASVSTSALNSTSGKPAISSSGLRLAYFEKLIANGSSKTAIRLASRGQLDSDADGQGDACDTDDDNDGVRDEIDCAVNDISKWRNIAFADSDGDGVRDNSIVTSVACFGSSPTKGYTSNVTAIDNCASAYNPDQKDSDEDGVGDSCEGSNKYVIKYSAKGLKSKQVVRQAFTKTTFKVSVLKDTRYYRGFKANLVRATITDLVLYNSSSKKTVTKRVSCKFSKNVTNGTTNRQTCQFSVARLGKHYRIRKATTYHMKPKMTGTKTTKSATATLSRAVSTSTQKKLLAAAK